MKRRCDQLLWVILVIAATVLTGCSKGGQKIVVNEAGHSVFYAPFYVAIEKGFFQEEGYQIELVNGQGADNSKAALLGEDCDIALMGAEVSVAIFNEGVEDYAVNFAQLTQRAGDCLVSRVVNEKFQWNNVKGKTIIGGRKGSLPQMTFRYILKKQGIDPESELSIQDMEYEPALKEFTSGKGDYILLYEPDATNLELKGAGRVVAYLGSDSGKIPFSVFAAKKSYAEKNPDTIQRFVNAIQKGIDYVTSHTPEETAKAIHKQFPDTDRDVLAQVLAAYYEQDIWKDTPELEQNSYTFLLDLMEDSGELTERIPYEDMVNNGFTKSNEGSAAGPKER